MLSQYITSMSYIQQPISRHLSGDTTMAGRTTMIPQTSYDYMKIPMQQAYDIARQDYFHQHALGPRTAQASLGMRGDTDNGHRYEVRGNSNIQIGPTAMERHDFGTPNPKRSTAENLANTLQGNMRAMRARGMWYHEGLPGYKMPGVGGSMRTREQNTQRNAECARRAKLMGQCRTYKGNEKLQKRAYRTKEDMMKDRSSGGAMRLGGDPSTYTPRGAGNRGGRFRG